MKIFAAGNDRTDFSVVLHALGYPYRLCSYFYLIEDPKVRDVMFPCVEADPDSEWILDSGLFSFMFGSFKGRLNTFDDYKGYAEKYVATVQSWGWEHAIVECDVQRVLGVDETMRLRDEVFRPYVASTGRDVIYVWHIPEGEDGLLELAKREKRIALSVPELRQVFGTGPMGGGQVKKALIHCLSIIRKAGTNPRVHLLGNTESKLITLPADSCDSTTWMSAGRFGNGYYYDTATRQLGQASIYSPKWRAWRQWCEQEFEHSFDLMRDAWPNNRQIVYYGNAACSAIAMWLMMETLGGETLRRSPPRELCVKPKVTAVPVVEEA